MRRIVFVTAVLLFYLFFAQLLAKRSQAYADAIQVDLSTDLGQAEQRGTGMHGATRLSIPIGMMSPIKISMVRRANDDTWQRGQALYNQTGHSYVIEEVFSQTDTFNDSLNSGDYAPWEAHVLSKINAMKQNKSKYPNVEYRYDIWNEPGGFDKVPEQTFINAWIRAAQLVKQHDPGKLIIGPSYADFYAESRAKFNTFLTQTKAAGVAPDRLSWHEGIGTISPSLLQQHVDAAVTMLASHGLSNTKIEWNEMISDVHKTDPGGAIIYFSSLERNGITAGAKAYWGDSGGYPAGTSPPYFLNHLLTKNHEPRSIWWAYRRYAEVTGRIVRVEYSSNADAVVAKDSSRRVVSGVVGKYGSGDVSIALNKLSSVGFLGNTVNVKVEHIPDTDINALSSPTVKLNQQFTLSNGNLALNLPAANQWEGYYFEITPLDGAVSPVPTATQAINPTVTLSPVCAADINQDGLVDLEDYAILVADFLQEQPNNPNADIDKDGIVDLSDYSRLVAVFFQSCS